MTEAEKSVIERMWVDGFTLREIAERIGYHWTSVSRTAHLLGLKPRRKFNRFTDAQVEEMVELRRHGFTYGSIGDIFGIDRALARYYVMRGPKLMGGNGDRESFVCDADETETLDIVYDSWHRYATRDTLHVMECTVCGGTYEHVSGDYEYCPRCGRRRVTHDVD